MSNSQEFSILDPKGMKTIAFIIEPDVIEDKEIYTLKKLNFSEEEVEGKTQKIFTVDSDEELTVLMLTLGKNKVIMNTGVLKDSEMEVVRKPDIVKYEPIVNEDGKYTYKEFKYTPNLGRPISIIDTQTAEEITPSLYIDKDTGEILGKCKMMPYRAYIAIELMK